MPEDGDGRAPAPPAGERRGRGPSRWNPLLPPDHPVRVVRRAALGVLTVALLLAAFTEGSVSTVGWWVVGAASLLVTAGVVWAVVTDAGLRRR